jgi:hypothetical protein
MNFSEWELDFVSSRAYLGTGDAVVARNCCTGNALIEFRTRVVSFVFKMRFLTRVYLRLHIGQLGFSPTVRNLLWNIVKN